ncbi:hypothetical protein NE237_002806 [Protea cynaroides]|uniref:Uncharacterized protein n=1 Tax=Protea cynaroides TaxID=273540 RepID=A0A9Q0KFR8_9MAGN|nr:hypothetical protein NE237_002806 [Protea cynaroides]
MTNVKSGFKRAGLRGSSTGKKNFYRDAALDLGEELDHPQDSHVQRDNKRNSGGGETCRRHASKKAEMARHSIVLLPYQVHLCSISAVEGMGSWELPFSAIIRL